MTYTHHIPGRIRVRSAAIKENPGSAAALRRWLEAVPGVRSVEMNALTGSVLIHYAPATTDGGAIIAGLRDRKWISVPAASSKAPARRTASVGTASAVWRVQAKQDVKRAVAKAIFTYAVEAAVERSVVALVAAIL